MHRVEVLRLKAIVHQGAAIHNSNVFRCRLYCLFGDGVCVMPLIPRLMKF